MYNCMEYYKRLVSLSKIDGKGKGKGKGKSKGKEAKYCIIGIKRIK